MEDLAEVGIPQPLAPEQPAAITRDDSSSASRERLRSIFDKCDKDGGGTITKAELAAALHTYPEISFALRLPENLEDEVARSLFDELWEKMDKDGDGEIEWEEFFAHAHLPGGDFMKRLQELRDISEQLHDPKLSRPLPARQFRSPSEQEEEWAQYEAWRYEPPNGLPLDIRTEPEIQGERSGRDLWPMEVFRVSQKLAGADGVTYLQLADGRGWVFDINPSKGVMCSKVADGDNFRNEILEESSVAQEVRRQLEQQSDGNRSVAIVSSAEINAKRLVDEQRRQEEELTRRAAAKEEAEAKKVAVMVEAAEKAVVKGNMGERQRLQTNAELQIVAIKSQVKTERALIQQKQELLVLLPFTIGWAGGKRSITEKTGQVLFSRYFIGIMLVMIIRRAWLARRELGKEMLKKWDHLAQTDVLKGAMASLRAQLKDRISEPTAEEKVEALLGRRRTLSGKLGSFDPGALTDADKEAGEGEQPALGDKAAEPAAPRERPVDLKSLLLVCGLTEYAPKMEDLGYDIDSLTVLVEEDEVEEMLQAVDCKRKDRTRFQALLRRLRASS